MLRDVGKPEEHRPPLTDDEQKRTAERRDADAGEQDRRADERQAKADLLRVYMWDLADLG
jgi:hypothetical protein